MKSRILDVRRAARTVAKAGCRYRRDVLVALILFLVAFGFRHTYVDEAVVDSPLRADALRYFSLAYDLHFFGDFSEETPALKGGRLTAEGRARSNTRSDTAPGYPLFLTLFISEGKSLLAFLNDVLAVQVVLGALTAVLTFGLARLFLGLPWATLAGGLTAISPHLIVLDGLVLSETLFTFVIVLGVLLLTIAWQHSRYGLTVVAGVLLALSSQIRTVSLFLLPFLAPVLCVRPERPGLQERRVLIRQMAAVVAAAVLAFAAYKGFSAVAVYNMDTIVEAGPKRASLSETDMWVEGTVIPPNYYMDGKSHVFAGDDKWIRPTNYSFWERPLAYVSWNLFAKYVVTWNWNNLWNGDVYIYPMQRKAFETQSDLRVIYAMMHVLHWPIFIAAMIGLAYVTIAFAGGSLPADLRPGLVAALALLYFVAILSLVGLVPRYSIPARPFLFIFAAIGCARLVAFFRASPAPA